MAGWGSGCECQEITIRMKPEATAKELIWELSKLFPEHTTTTIQ
jgi:hypothetical protein